MRAGDSGELLKRIEDRLKDIEARLERLERLLSSEGREARFEEEVTIEALALLLRLFRLGGSTVEVARAVRRLAKARLLARNISDGISRTILEVAAIKGPLNISALTMELRRYRGSASRRIVSARVRRLVAEGLLRLTIRGREKVVDLAE